MRAVAINEHQQVAMNFACSGSQRAGLLQSSGLTDLGVLYGATESEAVDLNDQGVVIGSSGGRVFIWEDGRMRVPENLEERDNLLPVAINNRRQIVLSRIEDHLVEGVLLWEDGVLTELMSPNGDAHCFALDINGSGQVLINSGGRSWIWQAGEWQSIPISARAINDLGQVAGVYWGEDPASAPSGQIVLWKDGEMIELGPTEDPDTDNPQFRYRQPTKVNNHGVVVGSQDDQWDIGAEPFVYTPEGGFRRLPGLPGRTQGEPTGLNDRGQIVGSSYRARPNPPHWEMPRVEAFSNVLWSPTCWDSCCETQ